MSPTARYRAILTSLARSLLNDKCMFFLGAGVSFPTLPTANELSKKMAEDCGLDWHEYVPLSAIAFYYESRFSRTDLNDFLTLRFLPETSKPPGHRIAPSRAIRKLMSVINLLEERGQPTYTISTNYDEQFEDAYKEIFGRDPETVIYKGAHDPLDDRPLNCTPRGPLYRPARVWHPRSLTVLYKIHGTISQPEDKGLVITEEDYINFLANALGSNDPDKMLLTYIMGELAERTVLFIGYSLSDWNFRAIFKTTVEKYQKKESKSYAIQFTDPSRPVSDEDKVKAESQEEFWHDKRVDLLNADGATFMDDLLEVMAIETAGVLSVGAARAGT
jgi:hypothetical protein